ncbi:hypothetical protein [Sodalinema sp.]|uniref:hypothetical protein n=1 Tax=Sodalinema sp. TaxID=3080550 RepID=UPI00396F419D
MPRDRQLTQWILVLLVAIAIGSQVSPALASADSRINRLESQVRYLESQLRQLDRQVNQNPFSPQPLDSPAIPPSLTPQTGNPSVPAPALERLATLVVEQKRRLDALEARLDRLDPNPESLESPNSP